MRSIESRFNKLNSESTSSYIAFSGAVKEQGFSRDSIARNFVKLVNETDYAKEDKSQIINHLVNLSNPLRTTK